MRIHVKNTTSLIALSRALAPILAASVGLAAAPAHAQIACDPAAGIPCAEAPDLPDVPDVLVDDAGDGGAADPVAEPVAVATPVFVMPVAVAAPVAVLPGVPVVVPPVVVPPVAPVAPAPMLLTLPDGYRSLDTVTLTTLGTAGDVTIDALGNAAIDTVGQPGLVVSSGGAITGRVTGITTTGDGAPAALLRAADAVIFTSDDIVSTTGDNAPGLDIQGRQVAVDSNVIRTGGNKSNGVQLVSLNGPIDLKADLIDTSGNLSSAALLRAAGNVDVNVGVLRTGGAQALGLDIATSPAACVLLGTGSCDVTAAADQITTNGFGGIGALVSGTTGTTTIKVAALQTGGGEAAGLDLAADPVVCATLGAGACDQNFNVGSLTTQGDRSPGALVRAAGTITGSVDVLRTNGNDAAGLDLASNPDACILLGRGNCGTSFNVGQLTTSGAGATGVLARVAGPTTGRVGVLETDGDNSPGIDIAGDPTACVLIGSGACDVDLAANQVTTKGNGAAGVLIDVPANILANIGLISTGGNNSPGLSIFTDPTLCLVLGPGSCGVNATTGPVTTGGDMSPGVGVTGGGDPIVVTTGPVTTGGDGSPGVGVTGDGPITVTTGGPVTTGGDMSPGVGVGGGDGPIVVTAGPVTTGGDGSPGIGVTGNGPITVTTTGPITTTGDGSPGIDVGGGGGDGPVMVTTTAGPITTGGMNSDGIDVTTTTGDQTIVAGPITVTGPGSSGIVATSPGCSAIDITATGPISAAQGTGILAASACTVTVTTLPGAPVSGQVAGIDVTSGTGSTITIGDVVSSGAGPAIDVNGAATLVTVTPTGTVIGHVDLTDRDDRLVNQGVIDATADSDFGGGADTLVNSGTLAVRPGAATAGGVTLVGLESIANSGLIDLRNGHTGDTLTLPGSFTGSGGSRLGVDVSITAAGATADRLAIGGAATGGTTILVNPLAANPGLLVDDLVLVDAGAGSSPGAFTLGGGGYTSGLVSYRLVYDAAGSNYALYGTPSAQAYELVKASDGARQIFYRTDDAWSGHMRSLRDADAGASDTARRGSALWGQMFGSFDRTRSRQNVTAFGQAESVVLDHTQDFFGGQIGYDVGGVRGGRSVLGITGGYANSTVAFRGNADRLGYDAVNGGGYAGLKAGPFFVNLLGKYEHYWLSAALPSAGIGRKLTGNGYGGRAEGGVRFESGRLFVEPNVAVDYAHTDLGKLSVAPTTLDFAASEGLRGAAGLRLGTAIVSGTTRTSLYASGAAVHEFRGRGGLDFVNAGQRIGFRNDPLGTYGHGVIGINIVSNDRVSGFIEANGDAGRDYKGGGGRAGLNIRF